MTSKPANEKKLAQIRAAARQPRTTKPANGNVPQPDTPAPKAAAEVSHRREMEAYRAEQEAPVPAVQAQYPGQASSNFRLISEPARADDRKITGPIVKYKKGIYVTDGGATVIPLGTQMIVRRMQESLCIFDKQTLVLEFFRTGEVPFPAVVDLPGLVPAEFAHLVSRDQSTWPLGPSGKPADPVQPTLYMTWLERKTLKDYTFITSSIGGQIATRDLARQIAVHEALMGATKVYAVIELQSGEHKSKKYDIIKQPRFPVADWLGLDLRPLPKEPPPALDDSIDY